MNATPDQSPLPRREPIISRTVWLLSLVSLLTDVASELLYPIMPLYLATIGFSVAGIGLLEGLAEAVAGLSKGPFGSWSDRTGHRLPFVRVGYGLSAISKPMIGLLTGVGWVFAARSVDRLGKGIRTAARDALLSDEATPATKGRVFGLHRAMDTLGAVIGPGLALLYLSRFPADYRPLFTWAFVPGVLAIGLTFVLRRARPLARAAAGRVVSWRAFFDYWARSSPAYRRVAGGLLVFAIVNSSDVFLLLKARESGLSDTAVIRLYMLYNVVYAGAAYPAGQLADRLGLKPVLVGGLVVFAGVYGGMSAATGWPVFAGLFALYGLYAAATEGIAKALISNLAAPGETATAIGTFAGFQSIAGLVASVGAGLLWAGAGPGVVFGLAGVVALGVAVYLSRRLPPDSHRG